MKKKNLALILAILMLLSCLTACAKDSTAQADSTDVSNAESSDAAASETQQAKDYSLAYAELGEGVWAIDYYMLEA